ncbi:AIPR family protein [Gluconobacter albidus]|uniref:AIPR family protein n=1 Tax=Gluconobacter TaxID=441 RepID=UPI00209F870D|nr:MULTISPECIES: AIPR family protein [Gluconobacter]MCP1236758.1 AIPR family protein [Gluconobacter kondonii]MCP1274498.1 AIPR family protein [Gluconobacter albidus]
MNTGQSRKYAILTHILDEYVRQGKEVRQRSSLFDDSTEERQNQARARAFIHLYLAATYGVLGFEDRELTITDGSHDGGIDAYHIDTENKILDIIQSKFRVGSGNFESKNISPEEILSIDLDRILNGHRENSNGQTYNGRVLAFIEKLQKLPEIARYKTRVTILANVKAEHYILIERLFHGDETNIVNFDRCYGELVMPTIRGEQHYTSSMRLQIDLSNKSNRSRLSAEIITAHGPSEVTVVLVPTIEIAKIMSRYKNSILRYNPRSYLEFREQRTNEGIHQSIVEIETGEFAILNNGITIVSDETYVNERVGSQNRAQVEIINPQIINGGQTAYTLARIYDDSSEIDREHLFSGKEVVVRIITLPQIDEESKTNLILSISSATNSQTTVSSIDRTASNDQNREIAEVIFRKTGLLYEPKRGEYSDALRKKYIDKDDIIERSLFTRIMYIAKGEYSTATHRKMMKNTGGIIPQVDVDDDGMVDIFYDLYDIYTNVSDHRTINYGANKIIDTLAFVVFVRAFKLRRQKEGVTDWLPRVIEEARILYKDFEEWVREPTPEFLVSRTDQNTGKQTKAINLNRWRRSDRYPKDVQSYIDLLVLRRDGETDPQDFITANL